MTSLNDDSFLFLSSYGLGLTTELPYDFGFTEREDDSHSSTLLEPSPGPAAQLHHHDPPFIDSKDDFQT
jgi:hypothetical protein